MQQRATHNHHVWGEAGRADFDKEAIKACRNAARQARTSRFLESRAGLMRVAVRDAGLTRRLQLVR